MTESLEGLKCYDKEAPSVLEPSSRLRDELFALESLLEGKISKRSLVRLPKSRWVSYVIGDASDNGYGAAIHVDDKLNFMYSQWTSAKSEQSSNYRELRNLVNTVEKLYGEGILKNCELFLYTDNSVVDSAYCRGLYSSRLLLFLFFVYKRFKCLVI